MDNTQIYKLTNDNGLIIEFIALGGRIKSVKIPNNDTYTDILVGYDSVKEMVDGDGYMGAICGRVANRIGNGKFTLEGKDVKLSQNNHPNHLHGGVNGFHTKQWQVEPITLQGYVSAYQLTYLSSDREENYPGNLKTIVIYALNNKNEFLIDIKAITDKATVVNLTSHPYFNLNGAGGGEIFNHFLQINADTFTPTNEFLIPTGELRSVKGIDMDFTKPVKLSERINSKLHDIEHLGGLDHNWVINKSNEQLPFVCRISEPVFGRAVEVYSTQPGIQVYTALHFDGSENGIGGIPLLKYCGIALEPQNFPDAINKSNFPNSVLKPDEKYEEKIVYKFIY